MKHMTSWISYLVAMFLFTTCADLKTNSIMIVVEDSDEGIPLQDVIGALMFNNEIIGKGISNQNGQLDIDFSNDIALNSTLDLYLNKGQYYQKHYTITYSNDNGDSFIDVLDVVQLVVAILGN